MPIIEDIELLDRYRKPINKGERLNRIQNATNFYPYYGATGQAGLIDDYLLEGEYVLLGEDGAPFLDKFSSKAYIVSGKIWVNNHAHILRSKTNNEFLMHYLNWIDYSNLVSGTTRLKLNQKMLLKIKIPQCSNTIKREIVNHIKKIEVIIEAIG